VKFTKDLFQYTSDFHSSVFQRYNSESCTHDSVSKSFRTESITKYMLTTINTRWEAIQRVVAAKLTVLTHKIAIQLHLMAESSTICSSRSRINLFLPYILHRNRGLNMILLWMQTAERVWDHKIPVWCIRILLCINFTSPCRFKDRHIYNNVL
jgi:hypothetical protein